MTITADEIQSQPTTWRGPRAQRVRLTSAVMATVALSAFFLAARRLLVAAMSPPA